MNKITKVDIDRVLKILKVDKPLYNAENKSKTIYIKGLSERKNRKLVIV